MAIKCLKPASHLIAISIFRWLLMPIIADDMVNGERRCQFRWNYYHAISLHISFIDKLCASADGSCIFVTLIASIKHEHFHFLVVAHAWAWLSSRQSGIQWCDHAHYASLLIYIENRHNAKAFSTTPIFIRPLIGNAKAATISPLSRYAHALHRDKWMFLAERYMADAFDLMAEYL